MATSCGELLASQGEERVSLLGAESSSAVSRCTRLRRSKHLVIGVVFVAMMIDLMLVTSIDPLMPTILSRFDEEERSRQLTLNETSNATSSTTSNATTDRGHQELKFKQDLESRVGILASLKPATEVVANIVVGAIVVRIGHRIPMLCGFLFNTAATLGFAYAPSFWFLALARVFQALASSLSVVAGLALISSTFRVESERSEAISVAFSGLSVGVVLGYPFGSVAYQFLGRQVPFIALALLMFLDGLVRLLVANPDNVYTKEIKTSAYCRLLKDPCVVSALICNFAPNLALGVFLATGPAWMLATLHAEQWQIGVVIGIAVVPQIASQWLTGAYGARYGRWRFCMLGMWSYALGMLAYPYCNTVWTTVGAEVLSRIGMGMIICVIGPLLGHLVDIRHESNYGEVFGLYTASYNVALTVGPLLGGFLVHSISFANLYRAVSAFLFLASFFCLVFREPKPFTIYLDNRDLTPGKTRRDFRTNQNLKITPNA